MRMVEILFLLARALEDGVALEISPVEDGGHTHIDVSALADVADDS